MSLMPNSSGVYPNSVAGFNASIANQSAPRPDAFGSFGTDPITGASYTDKASAQAALGQYANPNSNASRYLRSMQPTMLPGGGGGGGGGGRMGPREPRKKIMRMGARTASEYTAEQGGLSPQRPSTLDAAYRRGDFGLKQQQQQEQIDNAKEDAEFNATPRQDLTAFDKPQDPTERVTPPNEPTELVNRAKGGAMKIGQKPYLVGEEGPELIMPRANGEGYVLPADVTQQLLPMMTQRPTPRQQGGPMTMESRGGTFRGFEGTSSSGQPAMGFASNIPTAMMTPDAIARAQGDSVFVDPMEGRYQVDPNQPGMPLMPDVVTGPWAEPGMPAPPRAEMRQDISKSLQSLDRMPGVRAAPTGRYPGQTFQDNAPQARYDNAMKLGQNDKAALAYSEQDPFNGASLNTSFEELRDRVALRGMMYGDDYRDRQNRDRVQQDLANRAARAPIGTPTMLPGQGSEARIQANLARQMERLSRTPEGAQFLAQQQQGSRKVAERQQMIQPVPLGDTGQFIIPLTGQVINPETGSTRQMTPEEAQAMGLVAIESKNGVVTYGQPKVAGAPRTAVIKGVDHQWDAVRGGWVPATALPAEVGTASAPAAPSATKSFMDRFKK